MHAAVNFTQIQPGKMNEAIAIFRDSVVPAASQQQGNRGAILLTDPNTNKAIAVGLWDTEADAAAVITSGWYQEQVAKLTEVIAGPPVREVYEVSAQETTSGGGAATHAGVTFGQVQPGKMDEYVRIVRASSAPASRQWAGSKGQLWLTDPNTGKRIGIGLWETEADMRAFVSGGSQQEGRAKTDHLMAGPRTREVYEVSIHV